MSLSQTVPPVLGGILPNLKDEEDRKKWTEELDFHLPAYKSSKREVGRILKDLKDVYCRLGCRGNWSSFLQSKGIALRTAYDLIRRYTEGEDNPASKNPRQTHPSVLLKLPETVAGQAEVKAAMAKLGRAKATEIMFAALLQAAADHGTVRTEGSWEPQADFRKDDARNDARNDEEYTPESGGSAEFEPNWEAAADSRETTQAAEPNRLPQADQQDFVEQYPREQDQTGQIAQTIAIPESKLDLKSENKTKTEPEPPPRTNYKQTPTYIPPWWDSGGPPY